MSKRALAALGLTVLILVSGPGFALAQSRVDTNEFLARVARARQLAQSGLTTPSRSLMIEVRRTLGLPLSIELNGRTILIPKDPFLESLDGDSAGEFRAAGLHLAFLESQARAATQAPQRDPGEVSAALREAYRGISVSNSPLDQLNLLINRVLAAALEFLFRLLYSEDRSFAVLRFFALALIVLGLVLLAPYAVRRLRLVPSRTLRIAGGVSDKDIDWQKVFEDAVANGDFKEAVRARYHILLGTLAASGVIAQDPSLTAGECRQAVGVKKPKLFPSIVEATLTFERVTYGDAEAERADIDRIHRAEALAKAS